MTDCGREATVSMMEPELSWSSPVLTGLPLNMLLTYCWALNSVRATVCSSVPGTGRPGIKASGVEDNDEVCTGVPTDDDEDDGLRPTIGSPLY